MLSQIKKVFNIYKPLWFNVLKYEGKEGIIFDLFLPH
tara:strand:- start:458 stop:568 length:111 start_codon:yes stop_codon:yes gene_type:complete